jgi:Cu/Ag efflux protein CusF
MAASPCSFQYTRFGGRRQGRCPSLPVAGKENPMITRLYRSLVMSLASFVLLACMNSAPTIAEDTAAPPLGVDLGGSGPVTASPEPRAMAAAAVMGETHGAHQQHMGEMPMAHGPENDAHGSGTVNSVDPAQHKLNLSHAPIPEIGWPSMTMDFPVAPSVDLNAIKPGTRVNFTIKQQPGGMYEIKVITPARGGR